MKKPFTTVSKNLSLLISAGFLLLLALYIILFTEEFFTGIDTASVWVREWFGTFYLWLGLLCVIFLAGIAFSRTGRMRLGKSPPEFSRWSWMAMLYSAGMGAGILLRSVQEPVYMYLNPPLALDAPPEIMALEYTFYQWGFTAWAFYAVFALLIGYAVFIKKQPVRLGSSLKIFTRQRQLPAAIDILTIFTTVTGLVAAIALGVTQVEGGLSYLFSRPPGSVSLSLILVFVVCLTAFISAWAGMSKGIKQISNLNIYFSLGLLFFVFVQSDLAAVFNNFIHSLYRYLIDFIQLSIAYRGFNPGKEFLTEWTYYYWAFWLAWAPFTGIFIARISRGRSIREMILGVLIIPSLGTFFWFSVFGTASFQLIEKWGNYQNEFGNVFTSLFIFLQNYPLPVFTSILVVLLLISFLVTSVDSAIYVLSMFVSSGKKHPAKIYRIIWAVVIFVFSAAIILLGNIKPESDVLIAMQKFLIITSLPFAFFTALIIFLFGRMFFKNKQNNR